MVFNAVVWQFQCISEERMEGWRIMQSQFLLIFGFCFIFFKEHFSHDQHSNVLTSRQYFLVEWMSRQQLDCSSVAQFSGWTISQMRHISYRDQQRQFTGIHGAQRLIVKFLSQKVTSGMYINKRATFAETREAPECLQTWANEKIHLGVHNTWDLFPTPNI